MSATQPLRLTDEPAARERLVREWQSLCETFTQAGRTIAEATESFCSQRGVTRSWLYDAKAWLEQADNLAELDDRQRAMIEHRRRLVDAWRAMRRSYLEAGKPVADADAAFLALHPELSRSTLYRWSAARDSADPTDLLDRRTLRVAGDEPRSLDPPLPHSCSSEAWDRFKTLWLTIHRRTIALCHGMVEIESQTNGWQWPKLRTCQQLVHKHLPPIVSDYYRFGEPEWQRRWGPKMRRDYSQYRSNQVWVGDFHQFDVFCRRSESDPTIVRPLLSAFLDLRSRLVPGRLITLHENQDTVLLAFRHGVEKYGPPAEVVIDNGKPYRATGVSGGRPTRQRKIEDEDYVRSVFGSLDVAVHFSIPFNPDSKPVERWFRTVEEQYCSTFASYCGGLKDDRFKSAYKLACKHPELCPTVAELQTGFDRYLSAYHSQPHSGDGMAGLCPLDAFERFDPIPRVAVPDGLMDLLLMRTSKPVKVTRYGVRYNGIEYGANDARLFPLQGEQVLLKIDPEDAGYVVVCSLDGSPVCRANNNSLLLTGASQENVADGMKSKKRARKLVRQVAEGALRAAGQSVTDAAIAARLAQAEAARKLVAATGTDDATPIRNVTLLHSDLADSVRAFNAQQRPVPLAPDECGGGLDAERRLSEFVKDSKPTGRAPTGTGNLLRRLAKGVANDS